MAALQRAEIDRRQACALLVQTAQHHAQPSAATLWVRHNIRIRAGVQQCLSQRMKQVPALAA
jgi:hypothetical protein